MWSQHSLKNFTTANGLPSNTAYCVISDSKGYLWFSTEQGVARYDGNTFKTFTIDDGLTDNEVFRIFEDSKGRIWFLTYNGKLCFYQNNRFNNETNCDFLKKFKSAGFFTQVIEDNDHTLWFIRHGSPIYAHLKNNVITQEVWPDNYQLINTFEQEANQYLVLTHRVNDVTAHYRFVNLHALGKEIIGFTTENDYSYFVAQGNYIMYGGKSKSTGQMEFHKIPNWDITKTQPVEVNADCSSDKIYGAVKHDDKIFFHTNFGVYVFDNELKFIQKKLDSLAVSFICSDFENGLWYTTKHRGAFYDKSEIVKRYSPIDEEITLIRKNPYDDNEIYFVGVKNIYRIKNGETRLIRLPSEFGKNETVADLAFLDAQALLLGNGNGMCIYNGKTFEIIQKHNGVKQFIVEGDSVLVAKASGIAIQHKNQLTIPSTQNPRPFRSLYASRTLCILRTPENQLLYGDNDGVYKSGVYPQPLKNIFSRIKRLKLSKLGVLACSSDINGVFIKTDNVKHYTKSNGLISNYVNNVVFDSQGNLWVATNKGLSYIQVYKNKITNYGIAHGLADEKINDIHIINDSTLLLAASTGLYLFNPARKTLPPRPRVELDEIKVNGRVVSEAYIKDLKQDESKMEIKFSGISYYNNELEFYYQLNEQNWIKASGRLLSFFGIPPGEYTVKFKCRSIHNQWSNIRQLQFAIHMPFYKKWWFTIAVILGLLLVCGLIFYRFRSRRPRVS